MHKEGGSPVDVDDDEALVVLVDDREDEEAESLWPLLLLLLFSRRRIRCSSSELSLRNCNTRSSLLLPIPVLPTPLPPPGVARVFRSPLSF